MLEFAPERRLFFSERTAHYFEHYRLWIKWSEYLRRLNAARKWWIQIHCCRDKLLWGTIRRSSAVCMRMAIKITENTRVWGGRQRFATMNSIYLFLREDLPLLPIIPALGDDVSDMPLPSCNCRIICWSPSMPPPDPPNWHSETK